MNQSAYSDGGDSSGRAAGGKARAAALSSSEKSAIARKGAAARWAPVPKAVCGSADRPLRIGDVEIECYVLEDGTRLITQGSFLTALGRARTVRRTSTDDLPPIIQGQALKPFISDEVRTKAKPIPFSNGKNRALGYNAELLPEVCNIFLAARDAKALPKNQWPIADAAQLLVRGLAVVGITALVDEATGYQDVRTKDALNQILERYVDEQLQPYLTTFPIDFYREMFRLRGMPWTAESAQKKPQYVGMITNDIVYKRLAPGVLDELKRVQKKTPSGNPKGKLFQHLTQNVGYPKLREHLGSVVTLMRLSKDWDHFKTNLDMIHPRPDADQPLPGLMPALPPRSGA